MDLLKAFDTLDFELLIAKLHWNSYIVTFVIDGKELR